MSVRNFWLDATIDGRKTALSGGPVSKTGEMAIRLTQRKDGTITCSVTIYCLVVGEHLDHLLTQVCDANGSIIFQVETER